MASTFVQNFLSDHGISTDSWITLEGICQRIYLSSDSYIGVSPKERLFYFDSTKNLLYIKNLTTTTYTYNKDLAGSNGYIAIKYYDSSTYYMVKEASGGIDIANIGKVHSIISMDCVVGFYNNYYDSKVVLNEIKSY